MPAIMAGKNSQPAGRRAGQPPPRAGLVPRPGPIHFRGSLMDKNEREPEKWAGIDFSGWGPGPGPAVRYTIESYTTRYPSNVILQALDVYRDVARYVENDSPLAKLLTPALYEWVESRLRAGGDPDIFSEYLELARRARYLEDIAAGGLSAGQILKGGDTPAGRRVIQEALEALKYRAAAAEAEAKVKRLQDELFKAGAELAGKIAYIDAIEKSEAAKAESLAAENLALAARVEALEARLRGLTATRAARINTALATEADIEPMTGRRSRAAGQAPPAP